MFLKTHFGSTMTHKNRARPIGLCTDLGGGRSGAQIPQVNFFDSVLSVWYDVANREQSRAGIDANLSQVESGYQDCLLIGMPMLTGPYGTGEIKEYVIFEVIAPQLTYTYAYTNETKNKMNFQEIFHKTAVINRHPNPMSLSEGRRQYRNFNSNIDFLRRNIF